jgi:predicted tellurium resistance membrane protein TerC
VADCERPGRPRWKLDKGGRRVAIILGFVGVKLVRQAAHKTISTSIPEIPSLVSLGVIVTVLAASVRVAPRTLR